METRDTPIFDDEKPEAEYKPTEEQIDKLMERWKGTSITREEARKAIIADAPLFYGKTKTTSHMGEEFEEEKPQTEIYLDGNLLNSAINRYTPRPQGEAVMPATDGNVFANLLLKGDTGPDYKPLDLYLDYPRTDVFRVTVEHGGATYGARFEQMPKTRAEAEEYGKLVADTLVRIAGLA